MDRITELKALLRTAWYVAYQLELDAKEAGALEKRDFYHELNGEINSLEAKLMDFVEGVRHG